MGESPPNLEDLPLRRPKWQCNVLLHDNVLNPGPFDQLLLLKQKKCHRLTFEGQDSDSPQNYVQVTSLTEKGGQRGELPQ